MNRDQVYISYCGTLSVFRREIFNYFKFKIYSLFVSIETAIRFPTSRVYRHYTRIDRTIKNLVPVESHPSDITRDFEATFAELAHRTVSYDPFAYIACHNMGIRVKILYCGVTVLNTIVRIGRTEKFNRVNDLIYKWISHVS